jgi:hypothetical protein
LYGSGTTTIEYSTFFDNEDMFAVISVNDGLVSLDHCYFNNNKWSLFSDSCELAVSNGGKFAAFSCFFSSALPNVSWSTVNGNVVCYTGTVLEICHLDTERCPAPIACQPVLSTASDPFGRSTTVAPSFRLARSIAIGASHRIRLSSTLQPSVVIDPSCRRRESCRGVFTCRPLIVPSDQFYHSAIALRSDRIAGSTPIGASSRRSLSPAFEQSVVIHPSNHRQKSSEFHPSSEERVTPVFRFSFIFSFSFSFIRSSIHFRPTVAPSVIQQNIRLIPIAPVRRTPPGGIPVLNLAFNHSSVFPGLWPFA